MDAKGIIRPVTEPTAWVNSMVVNEKRSGYVYVLNTYNMYWQPRSEQSLTIREHYQSPTNKKSQVDSDATSGFWQITVAWSGHFHSHTPFGRYRLTVVPIGVTFAQGIFHRTVHEKFRDLPGCKTEINDILIWSAQLENMIVISNNYKYLIVF
jgi:hypothetical protein